MTYSCDIDYFHGHFPAQSPQRLYADIAQQLTGFWETPELPELALNTLIHNAENNAFVMNNGVMIANAVLAYIDRPVHMVYKIPEGLKIKNTLDNIHPDIVFVLLSPAADKQLHLRRLSRLTRLMYDKSFCDRLRQIDHIDAVRASFMYPDDLEEKAA